VVLWRGGGPRRHDRLRYRRQDDGWTIERLSP
jgi:pyridoxine/pyridoxamine 5'-phosphate oxidase